MVLAGSVVVVVPSPDWAKAMPVARTSAVVVSHYVIAVSLLFA